MGLVYVIAVDPVSSTKPDTPMKEMIIYRWDYINAYSCDKYDAINYMHFWKYIIGEYIELVCYEYELPCDMYDRYFEEHIYHIAADLDIPMYKESYIHKFETRLGISIYCSDWLFDIIGESESYANICIDILYGLLPLIVSDIPKLIHFSSNVVLDELREIIFDFIPKLNQIMNYDSYGDLYKPCPENVIDPIGIAIKPIKELTIFR